MKRWSPFQNVDNKKGEGLFLPTPTPALPTLKMMSSFSSCSSALSVKTLLTTTLLSSSFFRSSISAVSRTSPSQPPPTAHPHDLRPPHSPTTPRPSTRSSPPSGPPWAPLLPPSSWSRPVPLFPSRFAPPFSSLLHDLLCPPSSYRYLSSFLLSPLGTLWS